MDTFPLHRVLWHLGAGDARALASASSGMRARVRVGAADGGADARRRVRAARVLPGLADTVLRARRSMAQFVAAAPWRAIVEIAGLGVWVAVHRPAPAELIEMAHSQVYEPNEGAWRGQIAIFTWMDLPDAEVRLVLSAWSVSQCDLAICMPGVEIVFVWTVESESELPRLKIISITSTWPRRTYGDVTDMAVWCKSVLLTVMPDAVPGRDLVHASDDPTADVLHRLLA